MTTPPTGLGAVIARLVADALGGPQAIARQIYPASLAVVEALLSLWNSRAVPDIRRLKEAAHRRNEAYTEGEEAKAKKQVAEATEAANRANLPKRKDALARYEKEKVRAEAARTQAEAEAIRMDAETRRFQAKADAQIKLLEAISRLRQDGGEFFVNPENLKAILNRRPKGITGLTARLVLRGPDGVLAMSTLETETRDGATICFAYYMAGRDTLGRRDFPGMSEEQVYEQVAAELGLPQGWTRKDVGLALVQKVWNGSNWVASPPALSQASPAGTGGAKSAATDPTAPEVSGDPVRGVPWNPGQGGPSQG
jgi:hypothetical protein